MDIPTFEPASQPLRAYAGSTFATTFRLWENEARTVPFSLVGWVVRMDIQGVRELTEGDKLEVNAAEGEVLATLTAEETMAAATGNATYRYVLSIEKEGVVTFILRGAFSVLKP